MDTLAHGSYLLHTITNGRKIENILTFSIESFQVILYFGWCNSVQCTFLATTTNWPRALLCLRCVCVCVCLRQKFASTHNPPIHKNAQLYQWYLRMESTSSELGCCKRIRGHRIRSKTRATVEWQLVFFLLLASFPREFVLFGLVLQNPKANAAAHWMNRKIPDTKSKKKLVTTNYIWRTNSANLFKFDILYGFNGTAFHST